MPLSAYQLAKKYLGLHEVRDRSKLMELFKTHAGFNIDPAATPWCAAFINAMERMAGNPGTGSLLARSFLNYGEKVEEPQAGDIVVFKRGTQSWQGHVAYFSGFVNLSDQAHVRTLGGNQSNSVGYAIYPAAHALGYRRFNAQV